MPKVLPAKSAKHKKLIYFGLLYIKISMVHMQRNYRPVQKVPVNELFG